jgi:hypothetical protein
MLLKNTIVAVICGSTLLSLPAFSQENPMPKAEIGIGASMPLVENTSADGAQQSATVNCGFQGGNRFFFNKHIGLDPSYGYTHNTQTYNLDSGSIGVKDNSDGVLTAYVFRLPAKRSSSFVLVGAHIFDPRTVAGASTQTRLGHLYGGDADFNLKHRVFPRKEHRGVFYNSATFNMDGLSNLYRYTNSVEPAVVFGYSF